MKKRILSVALLVSAWGGYSQVGIGTLTPDKSSQLDVTANNKGILIPRVSLTSTTDTTTITNGNVNSLLVFNTATQNDITPGYYYWYIDKWKRMVNDDEVGGNVYYDGDTFTYVDANGETQIVNVKKLVQDNESQTVIITVDDQQYYISEAYLSANNGVVPTTVDPTAIPDGIYLIDVIGGVTNNFEEIYNNIVNEEITVNGDTYNSFEEYITHVTESTGGFTKIVYDQTTGDAIFQEWDEITNTWVNVDNSKFETIVQANESQTVIITVDDQQYYVSEAYLSVNDGVVPTTVDPTAIPDGIYLIDVIGGVTNNFEEIYNNIVNEEITVNGDTYNSFEEYITHVTESTGGFTKIVYDQTTGDAIFQEWDEITNTWVNVDNSKFETIVQDNESQTVIITVDDQQYYVSEAYLSVNDGVVPTTVDPTAIPDGIYLIDVIGGVTNNFEEIYNNIVNEEITVNGDTYNSFEEYITHVTESTGGFTKIVYDQTTGDAIFQEWDEITNTWVNVDNSKFETIVQANESQTLLVQTTEEDLQYYVAEQYLQNNPSPNQTEIDGWDPTALPAGVYLIDVIGGVTNNFEEIYNNIVNEEITVNGDEYNSFEEYITHVTESTGGFTKIVYDQTTGDAIFQEWDEITNTWVNVDNSKFETIVQANESQTLLVQTTEEDLQYYAAE